MGKVRYKEPSKNFQELYAKETSQQSQLRVSIGKERAIGEYYFLSTDSLVPYAKQARKVFRDEEINELAATIGEHGIQSPLLIIPSPSQTDKFEVISGERRLRAAKKVGLDKVPCLIIDQEKAEEVAIIENIQRSDLHPVEIGDSISSLLANRSWGDVSKLAEKLGKKQSTISDYLAYAKLPQDIKKHLIEKNIRSRDVLRNILKCRDIHEMEVSLGIKGKIGVSKSKSILRVNLESGQVRVQDGNFFKISDEERSLVIDTLKDILHKFERTDASS